MYFYEDRFKAVKLYIQYEYSLVAVIRELGQHRTEKTSAKSAAKWQNKDTRLPSARRKSPMCSAGGYFHLHPANGRKQKSRQKALKPRPFDGCGVQKKNGNPDTHRIKITVLLCLITPVRLSAPVIKCKKTPIKKCRFPAERDAI